MTRPFLPYGCQTLDDDDIKAVTDALRHPYLTTGPAVATFEQALSDAVGAKHTVAVCNGTAALHAACDAAKFGPGDEVLVPAVTFLASANCARYVGANPVFVDVDSESGLMDLEDAASKVTERTRAIIPVHLNGRPVDLEGIAKLARKSGAIVIEDAAHALGATYRDTRIGDNQFADMTIFSFHPVKHITTGEGGAITTNDDALDTRLRLFRNHGMTRDESTFTALEPAPWVYEMQDLGYNYRITDIQCALGSSQMRKLPDFIARRHAIAARYDRLIADAKHPKLKAVATGTPNATSAYHLYPVLIDFEAAGTDRASFMGQLRELRIGTQVHYIPIPTQPYYINLGHSMRGLDGSAAYYARVLSLPMYPTLTDADVDYVVASLLSLLG